MSYDFADETPDETPDETIKRAMSILGSIKTPKKARQSRINGRKHKAKSKSNANRSEITSRAENKVTEKD